MGWEGEVGRLCPHYGICGGCSIQHVPYEEQVEGKVEAVADLLGREPDEVLRSPAIAYYRNRMDYAVGPQLEVGMRQRGKWWAYVDIRECILQSPEADRVRNAFRELLRSRGATGYDTKRHEGLVRYLVIREGKFTGERMVAAITTRPARELLEGFAEEAEEAGARVDSLLDGVNGGLSDTSRAEEVLVVSGRGYIEERLMGYRYRIGLNSFFQTNSYTAELMVKLVREEVAGARRVYDIYSGIGTFTIPAAEVAEEAVGVESDPEAVAGARANAEINSSRADFMTAKAEAMGFIDADTVVLDPPRAGVHPKVIGNLLASGPSKVVYLSCNPRRQAEDLRRLRGYSIERLVLVDQFPHTEHVETVAVLRRRAQP